MTVPNNTMFNILFFSLRNIQKPSMNIYISGFQCWYSGVLLNTV